MTNIIACGIYGLIGGGAIYGAVRNFKEDRYFVFGVWTMVAVESALYMVKMIFAG